jgi:hypothetical protein
MRVAASIAQWIVRVTGAIQLVLGSLFWVGTALTLISLHMLSGIVLVLALWLLAGLAAAAGVRVGFVVLAAVWGLVVVWLGLNQAQFLTGSLHWIVQVIHLLLGLGAIGQAENLAFRIKGRVRMMLA